MSPRKALLGVMSLCLTLAVLSGQPSPARAQGVADPVTAEDVQDVIDFFDSAVASGDQAASTYSVRSFVPRRARNAATPPAATRIAATMSPAR